MISWSLRLVHSLSTVFFGSIILSTSYREPFYANMARFRRLFPIVISFHSLCLLHLPTGTGRLHGRPPADGMHQQKQQLRPLSAGSLPPVPPFPVPPLAGCLSVKPRPLVLLIVKLVCFVAVECMCLSHRCVESKEASKVHFRLASGA